MIDQYRRDGGRKIASSNHGRYRTMMIHPFRRLCSVDEQITAYISIQRFESERSNSHDEYWNVNARSIPFGTK